MSKRIVLVGGGHAHVHVVRALGQARPAGWEVLLVSPDATMLYSGMLPGVIAGHYRADELEIDLAALCNACGVLFRAAGANGIDRASRRLLLEDGGAVAYDLLSLDVGSAPALDAIEGAHAHGVPVKPLDRLLKALEPLLAAPGSSPAIAIVGGGPAGVELILALHHRLQGSCPRLHLIAADELLSGQPPGVRRLFRKLLGARGIAAHEDMAVTRIEADGVVLADGNRLDSAFTIMATGAAPPAWFTNTGLALSDGFVATGPTLQTLSDPDIFAAGDCAAFVDDPRPKAGVFAVRAGPPLAANLRARAMGESLAKWRPQSRYLTLLATGEKDAVASRGTRFFVKGRWVWRLKDWIDRRWLAVYRLS